MESAGELESALFEKPHRTASCSGHDPSHILGFGRRKRKEGGGVVGGAYKDSIEREVGAQLTLN
jgi:hypothetical protein